MRWQLLPTVRMHFIVLRGRVGGGRRGAALQRARGVRAVRRAAAHVTVALEHTARRALHWDRL